MKLRILSGYFKGRYIFSPNIKETRVATGYCKKSLFDILMPYLDEVTVLDLFAGSGSLGFEALSRGALSATFVDLAKKPIDTLKKNVQLLDLEKKCSIFRRDAFQFLESSTPFPFAISLVDPPYTTELSMYEKLLSLFDQKAKASEKPLIVCLKAPSRFYKQLKEFPLSHISLWKERINSPTALLLYKSGYSRLT